MSEPLRHERLGALCAPTCPGCRAAAKDQRAAERRGTLKTATLGTLVQEIGDRFTALSTENANLRTQAQTVADKTESLRTLDAARVTQIKDLEKSRDTERTRVRNLRQGIGELAGYAPAQLHDAGPLDFQLVALVAKKLQDLRSQLDDLESTASQQDESLSTASKTHRLIFDLVHRATGVRTEGLTVSEAVEKVIKALKDVQRMRDLALDRESLRESDLEQAREELAEARQNNAQMADAIERMRQDLVDRSRAYESETRELRDTAKKLRHQLDELRTAQAPRWYPVGTSPEIQVGDTVRHSRMPSTTVGKVSFINRQANVAHVEGKARLVFPLDKLEHVPAPEVTTLNNLLRGDEHKAARAYSWIDRDGDAWVWVPFVNQWMCVGRHGEGQDVSLKPSSEHGPYQRGERVSG